MRLLRSIAVSALGVFAFAATAMANSVTLPWIVKSNTVLTLVSLTKIGGTKLDLTYHYKEDASNKPESPCEMYSMTFRTDDDLILSFDASGITNGGRPIWTNRTSDTISKADFSLPVASPRRAVLEVSSDGQVYAEAMIVDFENGAAWGYLGFDSSDNSTAINDNATSLVNYPIMLKPNFVTRLFITPTGSEGKGGNYCADVALRYVMLSDGNVIGFGGHNKQVVCTGAIDVPLLLGETVKNIMESDEEAGFSHLVVDLKGCSEDIGGYNFRKTFKDAENVYVGKLEYVLGKGKISGNNYIDGTFNNFVILKPERF